MQFFSQFYPEQKAKSTLNEIQKILNLVTHDMLTVRRKECENLGLVFFEQLFDRKRKVLPRACDITVVRAKHVEVLKIQKDLMMIKKI
jgi:hypothetical protein